MPGKVLGTMHRTVFLQSALAQYESAILSNMTTLRRGIVNEAELRFAIGDPILKLFCSAWNLTVCGLGQYVVAGCLLSYIIVGESGGDGKTPNVTWI